MAPHEPDAQARDRQLLTLACASGSCDTHCRDRSEALKIRDSLSSMDVMLPNSLELSVVVPVRDRFDELRYCLRALSAQTLSPERFEILVCDDGSIPPVPQRWDDLGSSPPVIRYFRQPPRGPAAARNMGIRDARAPIVAFIDSDTIPQPGCLSALVQALAENPQAVGVEGAVVPPLPRSSPLEEAPCNDRGGVFLTANAAYRRDALLRVGGFDESFPYPAFEDVDLALKLEPYGRIAWAADAVVVHPWRRMTWGAAARRVRYIESLLTVALRHGCLGWRHHPTRWPRLRTSVAVLVTLPVGRILDASKFIARCPIDSLLRIGHSLAEVVLALTLLPVWLIRSSVARSATR